MKNFRILLSMISRNNDMEMPEHGDKARHIRSWESSPCAVS